MSEHFFERRIDAGGVSVRCLEAGTGDIVVSIHAASGAAPNALEALLAQKFRVLTLESPAFAATTLAQCLSALGVSKYALLAAGNAALPAAHLAAGKTAPPEALVLLAPAGDLGDAEARLGDIEAPTLVLLGTNEKPAEETLGRLCAERIPECYPMLVYDAASAMAAERPAAVFEAVADFIERRGAFILEREDSVISP